MRIVAAALLLTACTWEVDRPAPVASTSFASRDTGTVEISGFVDDRRIAGLVDAEVRVRLDGQLLSTRDKSCLTGDEALLDCELEPGVRLVLAREALGRFTTVRATVTSDAPRTIDGFELLAAKLDLPKSPDRLRYLHNGYQSWSFAGALDVSKGLVLSRKDGVIEYRAPNGTTAFDERLGLSSHDAILDAGEGTAFVVGFVSVDQWPGAVALEHPEAGRRLVALNGFTGGSVQVDAEHPVSSERLLVHFETTALEAMTAYGEALNERRAAPDEDATGFGQHGWFTWNRFFEDIDEALVLEQAAQLKELGNSEFNLVELDDGWQKAWGDWTPNEKFRPIGELAEAFESNQQRLGLWAAPFVVESTLPIVTEHPDWWVKTADGEPFEHAPFGTSHTLKVVDTTHPEALAWAVGNITALQRDGVDFFKFDYLYAAALDGQRHDPRATGTSALRLGLDALLGALNTPNINLCGVPWLHAALADASSIRIGADVAFSVGEYGFTYVAGAARNQMARAFGPLAARSDPDQFWLAPLTPAEVRTALTVQLLGGKTFALGDDLSELTTEQRSLLRTALEHLPASGGGMLRSPFEEAGDELIGSPLMAALQDPDVVRSVLPSMYAMPPLLAITNWSDEPMTVTIPEESCGRRTAVWNHPAEGTLTLQPHDSALFAHDACVH